MQKEEPFLRWKGLRLNSVKLKRKWHLASTNLLFRPIKTKTDNSVPPESLRFTDQETSSHETLV